VLDCFATAATSVWAPGEKSGVANEGAVKTTPIATVEAARVTWMYLIEVNSWDLTAMQQKSP